MNAQPMGRDLALALPLRGSRLIEASAGTGKTFTISALFVRLVLGHGGEEAGFGSELPVPQILVVTFTDAATQELRERIRTRLAQAARYFRAEIDEPDALIAGLRDDYPEDAWEACAARLELAAQWMDEAAVSTIHGWCQRMLREHAFDSGSLFTQTLETDHTELLAEVVRDYWRRHCYPLQGEALEWVERHWRTPDQLRGRLGGLLAHAQPEAGAGSLQAVLDQATQRRRAEVGRLKSPWAAWAEELRGQLDAAHAGKRFDGRKLRPDWYHGWLDALAAWAGDALQETLDLQRGFTRLTPAGLADACKGGFVIEHPALAAMSQLPGQLNGLPSAHAEALAHAAGWVRRRFDEEKRRRAQMGFDDMLDHLDTALRGANGERLAEVIRSQFPVALIDEFQDTDTVQYRIFDRIYRIADSRDDCALLLIGDPKQAIYAFRGADIYTYLRARLATRGRHYSLDTNYRSSAGMVDAVNRLFLAAEARAAGQGAFLFRRGDDNPLPFVPVGARGRKERWVVEGGPGAPLTCWLAGQRAPLATGAYRDAMAAGCATAIAHLLRAGARGTAGFERDGKVRGVRPADIAVLVRDMREAQAIRGELAARGVRSVYLSDKDSVFDGPEAGDVLLWLQACAEPDDDRKLRAALASAVLDQPLDELDALNRDERIWEDWVLRLRDYRDIWRRHGVLPMLRRFMDDFELPSRLARRADGERMLTNLLHLAELLQQASAELDGEQALIRYLAEHPGHGGLAAQEQVLRLESDEQLVKVVTVHKSKGLEYPLVFLPFACSFRAADKSRPPLRYHDDEGGLVVCTTPTDEDQARADHERLAEDLRLLYVALTRAQHACWLGVADVTHGRGHGSLWHRSALGYLAGGGAPLADPAALAEVFDALASPSIAVAALPAADDARFDPEPPHAGRAPVYREAARPAGESWWIASYSALRVANPGDLDDDGDAGGLHGDTSPETPEAQKLFDDDSRPPDAAQGALAAAGAGMHRFPRGPGPGTFLHGLFEWAGEEGFAEVADDPERIADAVARRCNRRGWDAWITPLSRWLHAMLNDELPLGRAGPGLRLADLRAYQVEMEFWFESRHADTARIDALVRRHVLPGAARPPLLPGAPLNGMFKGFMDLVFEHQGRYYVADYKSNWLGPADAAYTQAAMRDEILAKRYDLQYVLYSLALHRQLSLRLPGYDYDRHMGGAVYLFLRGSRAETRGVFVDRPPRALIEALDAVFAGQDGDAAGKDARRIGP